MADDPRKIPIGKITRLVRLAGAGARSGVGLLMSPERARKLAEEAADTLGTLRGLAAKVGQLASYVDGFVPDEHRPAYEAAMKKLRDAAPSSSPEAIRRLVEEELGAPIDRLFATWEAEPFASASIGQVHRATLADGRRVAVKVQHPGIDDAVRNDLGSASSIEAIVRVFGPGKLGSKQALAEISERFLEELDYRHEAEEQRWFRDFHADDRSIVVPAVLEGLSARRVLTSELLTGKTLEQAAEADLETRQTYARTLWRFVFRGNLVGGRFNADPHPGNYLFQPDGSVAFLDFGCVQPIPRDRQEIARVMHRAAIERDLPNFREATRRFLATRGGGYERIALDYTRRLFEPLFGSPYRITHAYVADIVGGIQVIKRELLLGRDSRIVPLPPGALFMNRLQFGFYSVLARLEAEVDYAAVERAFLA